MTTAPMPLEVEFIPALSRRRALSRVFQAVGLAACLVMISVLVVLIGTVMIEGWRFVSARFLSAFPSMLEPEQSGVKHALVGSIYLVVTTVVIAVPFGVGAAVYLNEYAPDTRLNRLIQLNIANLAGVPSVVYGLLGLAVFVRAMTLGRSILAAGLTMALLVLPVIITTTREALQAVPDSIRQAAYGLGATRWQTIRAHVLPAAIPGILTGVILSVSRTIGEAAPLVVVGAVASMASTPGGLAEGTWWQRTVAAWTDHFSVLPIQIYQWSKQPEPIFRHLAAAAILVLLCGLLALNSVAVGIRFWQQRRKTW